MKLDNITPADILEFKAANEAKIKEIYAIDGLSMEEKSQQALPFYRNVNLILELVGLIQTYKSSQSL